MNSNLPENSSAGRLNRAVRSVAPVTVDCSGWDADIPAKQWSTGKLVSVTTSQPGVEGAFTPVDLMDLEVVLRIEPGVKPAHAFAIAAQLVTTVVTQDPGLALTYNPARSRETDGGVVIVFSPARASSDMEARLEKIAEAIRQTPNEGDGIALNGVHVQRAA
jgi:hypothetical protein